MSAGSKTDVGAYHRDDSAATEENLADLQARWGWPWVWWRQWQWGWPVWHGDKAAQGLTKPYIHRYLLAQASSAQHWPKPLSSPPLQGQFSLMDHRPVQDIVVDLMKEGYVPSWCTACYRKGE